MENTVQSILEEIRNRIFIHSVSNPKEVERLEKELMELLEKYAKEISGKNFDPEFYQFLIKILEEEGVSKLYWDMFFWETRCCFNPGYKYRDTNGDLLVIPEGNLSMGEKMSILRASNPNVSGMACFSNYKYNDERRPGEKTFDNFDYFMKVVRKFYPLSFDNYGCAKNIIG